ncbi:MAG TPA: hypothetical protein VFV34_20250, partial [Blastocatellia bacterium]|nr:hypothetical protein [Blastocatellia bacterium]
SFVFFLIIAARIQTLANSSAHFSSGGVSFLLNICLLVQLIGFYVYLFAGAWLVHNLRRFSLRETSFRAVLRSFSYASLPLLSAWGIQAFLAWIKSPSELESQDFHHFVEAVWSSVALQADLSAYVTVTNVFVIGALRALGVFWLWHFATLWAALRISLGCSRRLSAMVICLLFAVVLLAEVAVQFVANGWQGLVAWNE